VAVTDSKGDILKQVETVKYLGSTVNAKGGCEEDVKNRIKAAWHLVIPVLGTFSILGLQN